MCTPTSLTPFTTEDVTRLIQRLGGSPSSVTTFAAHKAQAELEAVERLLSK